MEDAHLEFEKVEKESAKLAGGGVNYDITFDVNNGGFEELYEAKIWVKETTGDKYLLEFNLVEENHNIDHIIICLAKFALQIHNQQQDALLEFECVVKSKIEPTVEGIIYYITLVASKIGLKQLYQAKIWVNESTNYKELLSFEHVLKNSA